MRREPLTRRRNLGLCRTNRCLHAQHPGAIVVDFLLRDGSLANKPLRAFQTFSRGIEFSTTLGYDRLRGVMFGGERIFWSI